MGGIIRWLLCAGYHADKGGIADRLCGTEPDSCTEPMGEDGHSLGNRGTAPYIQEAGSHHPPVSGNSCYLLLECGDDSNYSEMKLLAWLMILGCVTVAMVNLKDCGLDRLFSCFAGVFILAVAILGVHALRG